MDQLLLFSMVTIGLYLTGWIAFTVYRFTTRTHHNNAIGKSDLRQTAIKLGTHTMFWSLLIAFVFFLWIQVPLEESGKIENASYFMIGACVVIPFISALSWFCLHVLGLKFGYKYDVIEQ